MEPLEQGGQGGAPFFPTVMTIRGYVLGHQIDFPDTLRHELVSFRHHLRKRSTPVPTFDQHHTGVEAFLIDFTGDLYNKTIRLEFRQRLRDIHKYEDLTTLVAQIKNDVQAVRQILTQEPINQR